MQPKQKKNKPKEKKDNIYKIALKYIPYQIRIKKSSSFLL